MATTNNKDYFKKMKLLRSHGITREKRNLRKKNFGFWYYEKKFLGFNYRMTEMSAALGISQMRRIKKFISKRRALALRYNMLLDKEKLFLPNIKDISNSTVHLYIIRIKKKLDIYSYNKFFSLLRKNKIGVNLHYLPISSLINSNGKNIKNLLPNSYKYSQSSFSIPLYYDLKFKDQIKIAKKINFLLRRVKI